MLLLVLKGKFNLPVIFRLIEQNVYGTFHRKTGNILRIRLYFQESLRNLDFFHWNLTFLERYQRVLMD